MQVLRLAPALIQRAKSGALVFGCFAQDDAVFVFVEICCEVSENRRRCLGSALKLFLARESLPGGSIVTLDELKQLFDLSNPEALV